MRLVDLELDLDVFAGPFDLLLTLILREEIDLLEVDLAEIVIAYIDHLEQRGELDLEAATEFLVLIAALLELKSRLLLPGEEQEIIELDPGEAAEELLASACSTRTATGRPPTHLQRTAGRAVGLPLPLGAAAAVAAARPVAGRRRRLRPSGTGPVDRRPAARCPSPSTSATWALPKVTVAERLALLRSLLAPRARSASTRRSHAPTG